MLVHVRLPPGFAGCVQHRPTNVHTAFYRKGLSACLYILARSRTGYIVVMGKLIPVDSPR